MSKQGRKQWSKKLRYKVHPYTFRALKIPDLKRVPLNELNSKKKLCDLVWNYCGQGVYDIRINSLKKNKGNRSPVTIVRVELVEKSESQYSIKEWNVTTKFSRRFASFKRIVGWQEK